MPTDAEIDTESTSDNSMAETPQPARTDVRDLQWVLECAERTPAGLSFYPPEDLVMRESAEMLAPQPGYLVVDLHGTTDRAKVGPRWLDADELATVLDACDEWDGRPIFLMCCDSGRSPDGFAQQLADRLQTEVVAPNKLAWSDFEISGKARPYASDGYLDAFGLPRPIKPPTGKFVAFTPRELDPEAAGPQREKENTQPRVAHDHAPKASVSTRHHEPSNQPSATRQPLTTPRSQLGPIRRPPIPAPGPGHQR
jgi:hypothetical protein